MKGCLLCISSGGGRRDLPLVGAPFERNRVDVWSDNSSYGLKLPLMKILYGYDMYIISDEDVNPPYEAWTPFWRL